MAAQIPSSLIFRETMKCFPLRAFNNSSRARRLSTKVQQTPNFGLLFDIDGVIVRGRNVLPTAPAAFRKLLDRHGRFRVPTVFVTNAGNALRNEKAEQLSQWLQVEIDEDQVIMAHSPLKLFEHFMSKHMLVSGQGPVYEIAYNLGFRNVTTMEVLRQSYPQLDCVDQKRRSLQPPSGKRRVAPIEALMLFGEPVRWETSLQLLLDVLMTGGDVESSPTAPHPHLPVLACNMDLQWMAEASMPRFGHGSFLLCLESLYKKVTGKDLIYTALVGKPSEITYYHAETMVQQHARAIGITHPITSLYAIGDNVHTDIFGMNLYSSYVQRRRQGGSSQRVAMQGARGLDISRQDFQGLTAEHCYSILVKTGVYDEDGGHLLDHCPRDFLPVEAKLQLPSMTVPCVLHAIDTIFDRENFA